MHKPIAGGCVGLTLPHSSSTGREAVGLPVPPDLAPLPGDHRHSWCPTPARVTGGQLRSTDTRLICHYNVTRRRADTIKATGRGLGGNGDMMAGGDTLISTHDGFPHYSDSRSGLGDHCAFGGL